MSVYFHFHFPSVEKTIHNDYVPIESDHVIGIDPGRCNIIYGVDEDAKVKETYRPTRLSNYVRAGIAAFNRQAENWGTTY